jgi:aspartyl-tRNA synthetase
MGHYRPNKPLYSRFEADEQSPFRGTPLHLQLRPPVLSKLCLPAATMSSEPPLPASAPAAADELVEDLPAATISKKQQKKDARKAEKAAQRQQQQQTQVDAEDPFASNYGDVPVEEIQSKSVSDRAWSKVGDLDANAAGRSVLIRGFAQAIRPVSKKMAFVVLRQSMSTVQCVLVASADAGVSTQMVKFATALSKESIVDVKGVVSLPKESLKSTTQQVPLRFWLLCSIRSSFVSRHQR